VSRAFWERKVENIPTVEEIATEIWPLVSSMAGNVYYCKDIVKLRLRNAKVCLLSAVD
jgi:hypothetical protein